MPRNEILVDDEGEAARAAIQRIEARLGVGLPAEYRDYLLAGLPWDAEGQKVLRFGPEDDWPDIAHIDRPYHYRVVAAEPWGGGVVKNVTIERMLDLRDAGDVWAFPSDAIAVAGVPMYGEVALFVRGPRRGQVWLKDWEDQEPLGDPEAGLRFVAHNFTEFLNKLRDVDGPSDVSA